MCKDGIRVVIADDEPITRMDLKELLSEEGYQVVGEAADGFDAVEACKQSRPDLVLMDIKMPLLDGLSAAKILFEENLADTVMMLTAYSEREFVDEAKHIGWPDIWSSPSMKSLWCPVLSWRWPAART